MSRLSDEALSRAFSALRETDRRRAPAFQDLLARSDRNGNKTGEDHPPPTEADLLELPPQAVRQRLWEDPRLESRSFVEPLLKAFVDKSQSVVHDDPAAARAWAALVSKLLDRIATGDEEDTWHRGKRLTAAAFEANALRVGGDLRAAAKIFNRLNRELEALFELDPQVEAKLASLEASLCIDNRNFETASRKIARAKELYREIGDPTEYACCLIKESNLAGARHLPEQVIGPLEEAAALLDPVHQSDLYGCTVVGRINALCDSGRPREAENILQAHWRAFVEKDSAFLKGIGQCLRGRVFLGQGRFVEAASAFHLSLDINLSIGRHCDAAMMCLFLAETYLALGDTAKLRRMATDAFEIFRSRGVAREMLAALRLLSEAAKADEVTLSLVSRLRRDLERSA